MIANHKEWGTFRDRLLHPALRDVGFKGSGSELRRAHESGQVHFVRTGFYIEDSVNLGISIHYEGLPPFRFNAWPGSIGPDKYCFECSFLKRRESIRFQGDTRAAEKTVLQWSSWISNKVDEAGKICGTGFQLLNRFPPETLESDLNRIPLNQSANQIFRNWYPDLGALIVALAIVARSVGDEDMASEYIALAKGYKNYLKPNLTEFRRIVAELASV